MEGKQIFSQEFHQEIPQKEYKEELNEEGVMEEIDALFDHQLHPETLRRLFDMGLGKLHKRFGVLIKFGEATKKDEREFIEASNGWREEEGPYPLEAWREKLARISIPPQETSH